MYIFLCQILVAIRALQMPKTNCFEMFWLFGSINCFPKSEAFFATTCLNKYKLDSFAQPVATLFYPRKFYNPSPSIRRGAKSKSWKPVWVRRFHSGAATPTPVVDPAVHKPPASRATHGLAQISSLSVRISIKLVPIGRPRYRSKPPPLGVRGSGAASDHKSKSC